MRVSIICVALVALSIASADTLRLRDGRVVEGNYLGGSARQVRMAVGDNVETFDVNNITSIEFGSAAVTQPSPTTAVRPRTYRTDSAATSSAPSGVEIPAGTKFVVRMIDPIDSERNRMGETFHASLDEPVVVNSDTVIPRGADAVVKLVEDRKSGKIAGRTELTLDLVSVNVNGRTVDINTQAVTEASSSRGKKSAGVVGGGAALGAIIGGIAGGGKGAAIGAGAGAATGAGVQAVTKGQRVHIPSETRLTFTLEYSIRI